MGQNPTSILPIAHSTFDENLLDQSSVHSLSNLYHYLLGAGVTSTSQILSLNLLLLLLTTSGILLARIHVSIEYLETQHTSPFARIKGLHLKPINSTPKDKLLICSPRCHRPKAKLSCRHFSSCKLPKLD